MEIANASYSITVGKNNPYTNAIGCITAGVLLGLPLIFLFMIQLGFIQITHGQLTKVISIYSGAITIGIITALTLPTFIQARKAVKLTGEISSFTPLTVTTRNSKRKTWYIVEYCHEGKIYQKAMDFASSYGKANGTEIPLLVYRKNPAKAITKNHLTVCIILTILSFFLPFFPLIFLFWSLPTFIRALKSEKTTGRLVSIITGKYEFSSIVKYKFEGKEYKAELPSQSSAYPTIGGPITLHIAPEKPESPISFGQVIFAAFSFIVFFAAGILFASLGFIIHVENDGMLVAGNALSWTGYLIWGSFSLFWLLLGNILLITTQKKIKKENLIFTGRKIQCVITEVSVNTSVMINGLYPVNLTCYGEGRSFNLKTRTGTDNCLLKKGKTINIFVDPENEQNFIADFASYFLEETNQTDIEYARKLIAKAKSRLSSK